MPPGLKPTPAPGLLDPVTQLSGVGPVMQAQLARLGIERVADLLYHLPLRYQDKSRITGINQLQPGQEALVEGRILGCKLLFGRQRSLVCTVSDGTANLDLAFFHFSRNQQLGLQNATHLRCYGDVRFGRHGLQMIHPEYQLNPAPFVAETESRRLTPVYPTTEGLTQHAWRKLLAQALRALETSPDNLQLFSWPDTLAMLDIPLAEALLFLHRPDAGLSPSQREQSLQRYRFRLGIEELLAHHLALQQAREQRHACQAPVILAESALTSRLMSQLPFQLTPSQQQALAELINDMASGKPMLRLVQGDVGSGKTVIAAMAASQVVQAGFQVAIMAPTEILASQLWQTLDHWFAPLGVVCQLHTGKQTARRRKALLDAVARHDAQIIIGTHALIQNDIRFMRLGLVIIDEQHRFGVEQRLALRNKGLDDLQVPHQLIMTATPIPRTLAMTAYADLDVSTIRELPPDRLPIKTLLVEQGRRQEVLERIEAACRDHKQAYWVCTLIEDSEVLECQAAEKTSEMLQHYCPQLRIGLVHGRMPAEQKSAAMLAFSAGELDLLVATTVIEVGVNVPNASLMVIENPERLGLAQLHQLRGRVGRGREQSYCVLLYQKPLSPLARERLNILRESNDGFLIAETDLRLRGPGELLGSRQKGLMEFRVADIAALENWLPDIQQLGMVLMKENPDVINTLIRRWIPLAGKLSQA